MFFPFSWGGGDERGTAFQPSLSEAPKKHACDNDLYSINVALARETIWLLVIDNEEFAPIRTCPWRSSLINRALSLVLVGKFLLGTQGDTVDVLVVRVHIYREMANRSSLAETIRRPYALTVRDSNIVRFGNTWTDEPHKIRTVPSQHRWPGPRSRHGGRWGDLYISPWRSWHVFWAAAVRPLRRPV